MPDLRHYEERLKNMKWYEALPISGAVALLIAGSGLWLSSNLKRSSFEYERKGGKRVVWVYSEKFSCKAEDYNRNNAFEGGEIEVYGAFETPPVEECEHAIDKWDDKIKEVQKQAPEGYEIRIVY